jgi:hypothetical protein
MSDSCGCVWCDCVKYTGERFAALRVRGASIGTAVAWCVDLAEQLKSRVSSLTLGDVKAKRECLRIHSRVAHTNSNVCESSQPAFATTTRDLSRRADSIDISIARDRARSTMALGRGMPRALPWSLVCCVCKGVWQYATTVGRLVCTMCRGVWRYAPCIFLPIALTKEEAAHAASSSAPPDRAPRGCESRCVAGSAVLFPRRARTGVWTAYDVSPYRKAGSSRR